MSLPAPIKPMEQFFIYHFKGRVWLAEYCQGYWYDHGRFAFRKELEASSFPR